MSLTCSLAFEPLLTAFRPFGQVGTDDSTAWTNCRLDGPPSSPPASTLESKIPLPLTLEQRRIATDEGIVPALQNIGAMINLDCRLDLEMPSAPQARNAESKPKVRSTFVS